jgi:hypothetical protein
MKDRNELRSPDRSPREAANLSDRLDGIGWALFFIWVGIAFLADVGWGWGLLGVGVIILSETVVRWYLRLNIGAFWVVSGLLFVVGGLWELLQIELPLVPVLLILGGVAMLIGAVRGRHFLKK